MEDSGVKVTIRVADAFLPFTDSAITRLGYLKPDWNLQVQNSIIKATVPSQTAKREVQREVQYALYREKIFTDTMGMRKNLLELVSEK